MQLQQQTSDSRAEIAHLRQQLKLPAPLRRPRRLLTVSMNNLARTSPMPPCRFSSKSLLWLRHQQLLSGKIDEQYQTKLESASKYRVRFSGIVLFNLFSNNGSVDNLDVPQSATDAGQKQRRGSRRHAAAEHSGLRGIRS